VTSSKLKNSPRKEPRQQRSRATVDAILQASAQVFNELGYASTTTDRIAARAGVSIGTLYQYFPSKDALLVALAEQHIDTALKIIEEVVHSAHEQVLPLRHALRDCVTAVIAQHEGDANLHRVLFETAALPPQIFEKIETGEAKILRCLQRLLREAKEVRVKDHDAAAFVIMHTTDQFVHQLVMHPSKDIGRDRLLNVLVDMQYAYLTTDQLGRA
jgi:AcrR family transcriptional regulator